MHAELMKLFPDAHFGQGYGAYPIIPSESLSAGVPSRVVVLAYKYPSRTLAYADLPSCAGMTETSCVISTVSHSHPPCHCHRHISSGTYARIEPLTALPPPFFLAWQFPASAASKVSDPGSGGQLAPGTSAKVVKADGTLAGVGECGELLVHGPQVVLGYYRNPKA